MSKKKQPTGDYPVGYARPPEEHKFKPGDRANPNGRPPKRTNNDNIDLMAIGRRVGLEKHSVVLDGRQQKISLIELGLRQMYLAVANGKSRNYKQYIALLKEFYPQPEAEEEDGVDYGAELRAKLIRMARAGKEEDLNRAAFEEKQANRAKMTEK